MRSFIATAALCAAVTFNPAWAQEKSKPDAVRIEMDQEAKAFIFIIDDEPVAVLDKNGLNVVAHVGYGGHLTDKGQDGVRREINQFIEGRADE